MPKKRYIADLTPDERAELLALTSKGELRARKMTRAQILLHTQAVRENGLARGLHEAPRPGKTPKLNGK